MLEYATCGDVKNILISYTLEMLHQSSVHPPHRM